MDEGMFEALLTAIQAAADRGDEETAVQLLLLGQSYLHLAADLNHFCQSIVKPIARMPNSHQHHPHARFPL